MPKRIIPKHLFWLWFAFLFLGVAQSFAQELDLIWERRGPGPQSRYGGTIFGLGDRNHDGFDDFAVFGWGWGEVGNASEPVLELFYGGDTPAEEPFFAFHGLPDQALTLWGAYEIGDINGDGMTDWIVAYRTSDFSQRWLYLYIGVAEFPTEPSIAILDFYEPWGEEIGISGAGDVNGDGYDDLYIHGQEFAYDHAMMWFGSEQFDSVADWQIEGDSRYVAYSGDAKEPNRGDVNGDGFDDILNVRWRDFGPFEVFWGAINPSTQTDTIGFNPTDDWTAPHITGDLNSDHRDEIVYAISRTQTAVFLGGQNLSPQADFMLSHTGCDANQGGPWAVNSVGDLNGDGYNELAVANDFCPGGRGTIWLYFNQSWLNRDPVITLRGWNFNTWGLREAASVGDVNGDGVDDLGIGAFEDFDFRGWAGILAGNPDIHVSAGNAPPAIVDELEVSVFPNPFNITTTIEISGITGGGDLDLSIYNVLGQKVVSEILTTFAGQTKFIWNAAATATGLHIIEVRSATQFASTKLLLLK